MGSKIQLTKLQVRTLAGCIRLLDGREVECKNADGKETGKLFKPYDLSAKTRYALAKTAANLQPELEAIEKAVRSKHAKGAGERLDVQEERDVLELLQELTEVEVHKLNVSELKIDTNQLPPSVLAGLMPMLEGEI